jgi:hypothetical protein
MWMLEPTRITGLRARPHTRSQPRTNGAGRGVSELGACVALRAAGGAPPRSRAHRGGRATLEAPKKTDAEGAQVARLGDVDALAARH